MKDFNFIIKNIIFRRKMRVKELSFYGEVALTLYKQFQKRLSLLPVTMNILTFKSRVMGHGFSV